MQMNLKRPNKALEEFIRQSVKPLRCPVHQKEAKISMPCEKEEVIVEACCVFFKKDVTTLGERLRKDFIYKAEKTRERVEKERLKEKFGKKNT